MNAQKIVADLRDTHYQIYRHAIEEPKKDINEIDKVLIFLSSNAYYELSSLLLLIVNKKYHGTNSLCRNILEKYIYIKFILEKDSLDRARDYKLSNEKLQLEISEKTLNVYSDIVSQDQIDDIKKVKNSIKNKSYSNKDKFKWYCVKGINSISGLFKYFNEQKYGYYYMKYSGEVHSKDTISKFIDIHRIIKDDSQYDNSEVMHIAFEVFNDILQLLIDYYNLKDKFTNVDFPKEYTVKI